MTTISDKERLGSVRQKLNNMLETTSNFDDAFSYDSAALSVYLNDSSGAGSARFWVSGKIYADTGKFPTLKLNDGVITATATELNIMDGVLVTTSELNLLQGMTTSTLELNLMDSAQVSTSELNQLAGTTITSFAKTILDDDSAGGIRSTLGLGAASLNNIDDDSSLSSGSITVPPSVNAYKSYIDSKPRSKEYLGSFVESAGEIYFNFGSFSDDDYLYYQIEINNLKWITSSTTVDRNLYGEVSYDGTSYVTTGYKNSLKVDTSQNFLYFCNISTTYENSPAWAKDSSGGFLTGEIKYYPPKGTGQYPLLFSKVYHKTGSGSHYDTNAVQSNDQDSSGIQLLKLYSSHSNGYIRLDRSGYVRVYGIRKQ